MISATILLFVLGVAESLFNELGKLVRPEMTPADVEMLFEQVVPDWMEFGYLVSELRTEHVQNMLFAQ